MTEYAYDPAYPYVVESKGTGYSVARFANLTAANNYVRGSEALSVIDTTPRLKIPEDALYILAESQLLAKVVEDEYSYWYCYDNDTSYDEGSDLLNFIGSREITVLVPKKEA